MGEPDLTLPFASEAALTAFAAGLAQRWRTAGCRQLSIGLSGELGSGKTTWVRAMLRGLGYAGRVPSPTYTLLEQYSVDGLSVVHLDLYRLQEAAELEHLGVRDWMGQDGVWLLVEWPERAPALVQGCDVSIALALTGSPSRRATLVARSAAGRRALEAALEFNSNYSG